MSHLNLPEFEFKLKKENGKTYIFDQFRKKYVVNTPEEWVRQHFLKFLVQNLSYPASLLAVEKQLIINGLKKRCDAVVYNNQAQPIMIIEFKAPNVAITQAVFDQAAVYNSKLGVDFLIVSNGISHYFCKVNKQDSKYIFFEKIPEFSSLSSL